MAGKIRPRLKSLFSPDADPLDQFMPDGPFGILVMAMIGPADSPGQESFDFMLCTPDWFASKMKSNIVEGRHHLFVKDFNYAQLKKFIEDYCVKCSANSWPEVAEKLTRLGKWEFEDYAEYRPPPAAW